MLHLSTAFIYEICQLFNAYVIYQQLEMRELLFEVIFCSSIYVTDDGVIMTRMPQLNVRRIEQLKSWDDGHKSGDFYLCRYCNLKFVKKYKRTIHEGNCSRNEKINKSILRDRFCCNNCGCHFNRRDTLIHHTTKDCGVIHKCEKCNKIFGTILGLKKHIRNYQCQ